MPTASIALVPVPVWDIELITPQHLIQNVLGISMNPSFYYLTTSQFPNGAANYNPSAGSAGGTGVVSFVDEHEGLVGDHFGTTSAVFAQSYWYPWWMMQFGQGSVNPGVIYPSPGGVVAVLDYLIATNGVTNIGTGVMVLAFNGTGCSFNEQPQGSSPRGGFGIVGDGAGNLQFVTWEGGTGNVLSTVAIGAAIVPDFSLWSTYRFIIQAGDDVNPALLSLEVNGTVVVDQLEFGSGTLQRPDEAVAGGYMWCTMYAGRVPAGAEVFVRFHGRWGRSLPSGVAVQPQ
ncbi:hypothetical protein LCGC14_1390740 [marine sediment metagenome]|uniref:Uncharacterized protein n=1 Tax=marine sediment metagenome TaxID=412755 RepID=A0A0F9K016_9ZZZZ